MAAFEEKKGIKGKESATEDWSNLNLFGGSASSSLNT